MTFINKFTRGALIIALGMGLFVQNLTPTIAFANDDFEAEMADEFAEEETADDSADVVQFSGFLEIERGAHIGSVNDGTKDWVLDNTRFRLQGSKETDNNGFFFKLDFYQDGVTHNSYLDVKEARIKMTPVDWMDLSIGKQVSTWGVADMLFINDLFPKNWVSNFLGRDMESMKDSANSFRMTTYAGDVTWDVVYTPEFTPDTTPNGCRLPVYDPNTAALVADPASCTNNPVSAQQTGLALQDEMATRLQMKAGDYELALYGYSGFYKNPKGLELVVATLFPIYPALDVVGASLEGQLGPGIFSMEVGSYTSQDDVNGTNALIENSMQKAVLGYKLDVSSNFTIGLQWYAEKMEDYAAYEQSILDMLVAGGATLLQAQASDMYVYRKEEVHNTQTLRVTFKAQQETLWMNLFVYNRTQDKDSFIKFDLDKKIDNSLSVAMGVNIFDGADKYLDREFGMLRNADNAFMRMKYLY